MAKWTKRVAIALYLLGYAGADSSFGFVAQAHAERLVPIHEMQSDRAIVFIHGLFGDPITTFTAKNSPHSWGELIADDNDAVGLAAGPTLNEYAVYAVDYTSLFAKPGISVQEAAVAVRNILVNNGIFQRYNQIIIVTHSLGGIITKRLILEFKARDQKKYIDRISAVFFLAVPSQGASLANLSDLELSKLMARMFGLNYRIVTDLQPRTVNTFLDALEADWVEFLVSRERNSHFPVVYCAYETDPVALSTIVVNSIFASTRCSGSAEAIARDHLGIVKPVDRADYIYGWVKHRIGLSSAVTRSSGVSSWGPDRAGDPIETLGAYLETLRELHSDEENRDAATQIMEVEEEIIIDSEDSSIAHKFYPRPKKYTGFKPADVLDEIERLNDCVQINTTKDRRSVRVSFDMGRVKTCGVGRDERFGCECP